ncbi:Telomerase protein component 1, partial [Serendipita sp. 399]
MLEYLFSGWNKPDLVLGTTANVIYGPPARFQWRPRFESPPANPSLADLHRAFRWLSQHKQHVEVLGAFFFLLFSIASIAVFAIKTVARTKSRWNLSPLAVTWIVLYLVGEVPFADISTALTEYEDFGDLWTTLLGLVLPLGRLRTISGPTTYGLLLCGIWEFGVVVFTSTYTRYGIPRKESLGDWFLLIVTFLFTASHIDLAIALPLVERSGREMVIEKYEPLSSFVFSAVGSAVFFIVAPMLVSVFVNIVFFQGSTFAPLDPLPVVKESQPEAVNSNEIDASPAYVEKVRAFFYEQMLNTRQQIQKLEATRRPEDRTDISKLYSKLVTAQEAMLRLKASIYAIINYKLAHGEDTRAMETHGAMVENAIKLLKEQAFYLVQNFNDFQYSSKRHSPDMDLYKRLRAFRQEMEQFMLEQKDVEAEEDNLRDFIREWEERVLSTGTGKLGLPSPPSSAQTLASLQQQFLLLKVEKERAEEYARQTNQVLAEEGVAEKVNAAVQTHEEAKEVVGDPSESLVKAEEEEVKVNLDSQQNITVTKLEHPGADYTAEETPAVRVKCEPVETGLSDDWQNTPKPLITVAPEEPAVVGVRAEVVDPSPSFVAPEEPVTIPAAGVVQREESVGIPADSFGEPVDEDVKEPQIVSVPPNQPTMGAVLCPIEDPVRDDTTVAEEPTREENISPIEDQLSEEQKADIETESTTGGSEEIRFEARQPEGSFVLVDPQSPSTENTSNIDASSPSQEELGSDVSPSSQDQDAVNASQGQEDPIAGDRTAEAEPTVADRTPSAIDLITINDSVTLIEPSPSNSALDTNEEEDNIAGKSMENPIVISGGSSPDIVPRSASTEDGATFDVLDVPPVFPQADPKTSPTKASATTGDENAEPSKPSTSAAKKSASHMVADLWMNVTDIEFKSDAFLLPDKSDASLRIENNEELLTADDVLTFIELGRVFLARVRGNRAEMTAVSKVLNNLEKLAMVAKDNQSTLNAGSNNHNYFRTCMWLGQARLAKFPVDPPSSRREYTEIPIEGIIKLAGYGPGGIQSLGMLPEPEETWRAYLSRMSTTSKEKKIKELHEWLERYLGGLPVLLDRKVPRAEGWENGKSLDVNRCLYRHLENLLLLPPYSAEIERAVTIFKLEKDKTMQPDAGLVTDMAENILDSPPSRNVVIMGFPAAGLEGFYRNPREDVKRFLDIRHGDKYRIFNFCPTNENSYPASTFYGRVSRYPFPDHHAPPIGLLALATQEMEAWLARGPDYTIVVHCKAGKGRSGTLACSLLLRMDDAIAPPKLQRSYNVSEWADERANEILHEVESETENQRHTLGEESDIPPTTDAETSADEQESPTIMTTTTTMATTRAEPIPTAESTKLTTTTTTVSTTTTKLIAPRNSLTVPKEERGSRAASTVDK